VAKGTEGIALLNGDVAAVQKVIEAKTAESQQLKTAWDGAQQALAKLQADLQNAPKQIADLKPQIETAKAKAEEDKLILDAIGEEIAEAKAVVDRLSEQYAQLSTKMK
jgi:peptidoglycan hydrolase CwlO-like protein